MRVRKRSELGVHILGGAQVCGFQDENPPGSQQQARLNRHRAGGQLHAIPRQGGGGRRGVLGSSWASKLQEGGQPASPATLWVSSCEETADLQSGLHWTGG